jgi:transcriptional regulator with XRE-family HTH domain
MRRRCPRWDRNARSKIECCFHEINATRSAGYRSSCSQIDSQSQTLVSVEQILQRLGQRIHEIRVQRGFASQEALADYLKVHRTFVGHLETGRKDFRLSTIIRLADALGVPLADLFAGLEADESFKTKRRGDRDAQSRFALLKELDVLERTVQKVKALVSAPSKTG